jgi:hypothetical protein
MLPDIKVNKDLNPVSNTQKGPRKKNYNVKIPFVPEKRVKYPKVIWQSTFLHGNGYGNRHVSSRNKPMTL